MLAPALALALLAAPPARAASRDLVAALGWLSLAAPAAAQDAVRLWGAVQPSAAVEVDGAPTDAEIQFLAYGARLMTPPIRFLDGRLLWINGGSFLHIHPTITDSLLSDDVDNDMCSLSWEVILSATLSERWSVAAMVSPGLHSNFVAPLSSRDVQMQALGFVSFDLSERSRLGLGGGYANLFGVPRAFPVVSAAVDGGRVRVEALVPRDVGVWFELVDDTVSLGAQWTLQGGYFHRGSDEARAPDDAFLQFSTGALGPALDVQGGPVRVTAELGWAAFRRFDIHRGDDLVAEFELAPGPAGRLSVALTPKRGAGAGPVPRSRRIPNRRKSRRPPAAAKETPC